MYKILCTGSIGSGKSTACKMFQELGVSVYYSDKQAAGIMNKDKGLVQKIKDAFGKHLYEDGVLNRKALAAIVFNNKEKLNTLNNIVHPVVSNHFDKWCEAEEFMSNFNSEPEEEKVDYIIEEAAIAIELGIKDRFDYVVVVTADEDTRIERVMARDNCNKDAVLVRMNNQMSDEDKCSHADFLIKNNDLESLEIQVKEVHEKIIEAIKASWLEL